ncbi:hypothetical protein BDV29DRAFT_153899 [Aspergillus leporis]|uniref:Uncharacterized protein n=1 Tax=Aspergillus leporis TaxID=41062 RepID=A0A5N5X8V4_9EURO|nr:hypothetical protein BDV29DRAFT_153899 [Aspergillus leporis]
MPFVSQTGEGFKCLIGYDDPGQCRASRVISRSNIGSGSVTTSRQTTSDLAIANGSIQVFIPAIVHKTHLYFYSALSYEISGRAAHKFSISNIPLLRRALEYYVACTTFLPSPIPISATTSDRSCPISLGDFSSSSMDSDSPSPARSLVISITDIIVKSIQWVNEDPFIRENDSCEDPVIDAACAASHDAPNQLLCPLPLLETSKVSARLPPPLSIKIVPHRLRSEHGSITDTQLNIRDSQRYINNVAIILSKSVAPMTSVYADVIKRHNRSIQGLRAELDYNSTSVRALIDQIPKKQHARKKSKSIRRSASFWSFSPVKDGESEQNKVLDPPSSPGNEMKK